MVWPLPLQLQGNPILSILKYSHFFSFPLTEKEIWYWQIKSRYSPHQIKKHLTGFSSVQGYFFLPGQKVLVKKRLVRQSTSRNKWKIALSTSKLISRVPFVWAVFVTGALAMNNSPINDDIDIMVITAPHTMWFTRFFVSLFLKVSGKRREPNLPEHSSRRVKDKICDNLWLDSNALDIFHHNLYQAHEILQAKCIFDRGGVYQKFITSNGWVGEYLPIAYRETCKSLPPSFFPKASVLMVFAPLLSILNFAFYILQFIYMLPHKSVERIGLSFALFHPRKHHDYDII